MSDPNVDDSKTNEVVDRIDYDKSDASQVGGSAASKSGISVVPQPAKPKPKPGHVEPPSYYNKAEQGSNPAPSNPPEGDSQSAAASVNKSANANPNTQLPERAFPEGARSSTALAKAAQQEPESLVTGFGLWKRRFPDKPLLTIVPPGSHRSTPPTYFQLAYESPERDYVILEQQPGVRGSISTVHMAQWVPKKNGKRIRDVQPHTQKNIVSLKVMRSRSSHLRDIYDLLFILRHPNIINVIDFMSDPVRGHCTMVTDWINGVNLMQMVKCSSPQGINEIVAANIARQIVAGLSYLHQRRIDYCYQAKEGDYRCSSTAQD